MDATVLDRIRQWLDNQSIPYRAVHHEPTFTSEQSARARGEDVHIGGKALLIKTGEDFRLFVLSAALKLDSSALRKHLGVKAIRFATPEELNAQTGLVPGSVPPFGKPILPFDLFADESILANDKIAFNAGTLTDSLIMSVPDYLKAAQPAILRFAAQ